MFLLETRESVNQLSYKVLDRKNKETMHIEQL